MNRRSVLHAVWFTLAVAAFSSVWLVVMTVTGWYRDPDRMEIAIAVPVVTIVLLVLASRQLRRDGCSILARLALCLAIAGVIGSLAGLAVFPGRGTPVR